MRYVYLLQSIGSGGRFYVGLAKDLRDRLKRHNAREVKHTAKHLPWKLKTYIAFSDGARAIAFEKYLKSGSGRAFAKRHL
jgi:predicted GIY-YIG superfamily endonuclease